MSDTKQADEDLALSALNSLSETTASSTEGLTAVNSQLAEARRRRRCGWSWLRIASDTDVPNPLAIVTAIAADLAISAGEFRRALAHSLRSEGLPLSKIASLLDVSGQRVGALLHRARQSEKNAEVEGGRRSTKACPFAVGPGTRAIPRE